MNDLSAPTTKQLSSDEASALDGVATAPNPKPLKRLVASHLQKSYGGRQVVKDVSLAINEGQVVGLLGPNGAGKTTSFYMIVGLVRADGGEIELDGERIERQPMHRRATRGLGYLPQEASIFRKLNVQDNVRAVLELQRDA
jgi:lipopolysaccharide export system ATP-binding protein